MSTPSPLALIGGRWAVSLRVWIILVLLMQIPVIVRSSEHFAGFNPVILLPGIAGALAMGVVLWIADLTILRHRAVQPVSGWLVLGIWILAAVIRLFVTEGVLSSLIQEDLSLSFLRLITSTISIVGWTWLLTYFLALGTYYREVSDDLLASSERLRAVSDQQMLDHDELLASLASSVNDAVLPALNTLEHEIAALDDRSSEEELMALSERVGGYSRQLVREVSHEIAVGDPYEHTDAVDGRGGPSGRSGADKAPWSISIGWAPLLVATSTVPLAATNLGPPSTLRILVGLAWWFAALVVLKAAQAPIRRRIARASLLYVVVGNVVAIAVGILGQAPFFGPVNPASLLAFSSAAFIAGIVASAMSRTIDRLRRDNELLARQNAMFIDATAQRDAMNALLRQQVSQLLHGPVQGRLAAVALSLRLYVAARARGDLVSAQATFQRCRALLEQVNRDIEAIRSGGLDRGMSLQERLDQLRDRWTGLVDLTWTLDSEIGMLVDANPNDQRQVFTAVEEAVNNACSHGRARAIAVTIGLGGDGCMRIVAADDGRGPAEHTQPGLGLREIERVGGSWSLTAGKDRGAVLTLEIPFQSAGVHAW